MFKHKTHISFCILFLLPSENSFPFTNTTNNTLFSCVYATLELLSYIKHVFARKQNKSLLFVC